MSSPRRAYASRSDEAFRAKAADLIAALSDRRQQRRSPRARTTSSERARSSPRAGGSFLDRRRSSGDNRTRSLSQRSVSNIRERWEHTAPPQPAEPGGEIRGERRSSENSQYNWEDDKFHRHHPHHRSPRHLYQSDDSSFSGDDRRYRNNYRDENDRNPLEGRASDDACCGISGFSRDPKGPAPPDPKRMQNKPHVMRYQFYKSGSEDDTIKGTGKHTSTSSTKIHSPSKNTRATHYHSLGQHLVESCDDSISSEDQTFYTTRRVDPDASSTIGVDLPTSASFAFNDPPAYSASASEAEDDSVKSVVAIPTTTAAATTKKFPRRKPSEPPAMLACVASFLQKKAEKGSGMDPAPSVGPIQEDSALWGGRDDSIAGEPSSSFSVEEKEENMLVTRSSSSENELASIPRDPSLEESIKSAPNGTAIARDLSLDSKESTEAEVEDFTKLILKDLSDCELTKNKKDSTKKSKNKKNVTGSSTNKFLVGPRDPSDDEALTRRDSSDNVASYLYSSCDEKSSKKSQPQNYYSSSDEKPVQKGQRPPLHPPRDPSGDEAPERREKRYSFYVSESLKGSSSGEAEGNDDILQTIETIGLTTDKKKLAQVDEDDVFYGILPSPFIGSNVNGGKGFMKSSLQQMDEGGEPRTCLEERQVSSPLPEPREPSSNDAQDSSDAEAPQSVQSDSKVVVSSSFRLFSLSEAKPEEEEEETIPQMILKFSAEKSSTEESPIDQTGNHNKMETVEVASAGDDENSPQLTLQSSTEISSTEESPTDNDKIKVETVESDSVTQDSSMNLIGGINNTMEIIQCPLLKHPQTDAVASHDLVSPTKNSKQEGARVNENSAEEHDEPKPATGGSGFPWASDSSPVANEVIDMQEDLSKDEIGKDEREAGESVGMGKTETESLVVNASEIPHEEQVELHINQLTEEIDGKEILDLPSPSKDDNGRSPISTTECKDVSEDEEPDSPCCFSPPKTKAGLHLNVTSEAPPSPPCCSPNVQASLALNVTATVSVNNTISAAPVTPSSALLAALAETLTAMGFPENDAKRCLQAAQGDLDLAVEFLTTGIPKGLVFSWNESGDTESVDEESDPEPTPHDNEEMPELESVFSSTEEQLWKEHLPKAQPYPAIFADEQSLGGKSGHDLDEEDPELRLLFSGVDTNEPGYGVLISPISAFAPPNSKAPHNDRGRNCLDGKETRAPWEEQEPGLGLQDEIAQKTTDSSAQDAISMEAILGDDDDEAEEEDITIVRQLSLGAGLMMEHESVGSVDDTSQFDVADCFTPRGQDARLNINFLDKTFETQAEGKDKNGIGPTGFGFGNAHAADDESSDGSSTVFFDAEENIIDDSSVHSGIARNNPFKVPATEARDQEVLEGEAQETVGSQGQDPAENGLHFEEKSCKTTASIGEETDDPHEAEVYSLSADIKANTSSSNSEFDVDDEFFAELARMSLTPTATGTPPDPKKNLKLGNERLSATADSQKEAADSTYELHISGGDIPYTHKVASGSVLAESNPIDSKDIPPSEDPRDSSPGESNRKEGSVDADRRSSLVRSVSSKALSTLYFRNEKNDSYAKASSDTKPGTENDSDAVVRSEPEMDTSTAAQDGNTESSAEGEKPTATAENTTLNKSKTKSPLSARSIGEQLSPLFLASADGMESAVTEEHSATGNEIDTSIKPPASSAQSSSAEGEKPAATAKNTTLSNESNKSKNKAQLSARSVGEELSSLFFASAEGMELAATEEHAATSNEIDKSIPKAPLSSTQFVGEGISSFFFASADAMEENTTPSNQINKSIPKPAPLSTRSIGEGLSSFFFGNSPRSPSASHTRSTPRTPVGRRDTPVPFGDLVVKRTAARIATTPRSAGTESARSASSVRPAGAGSARSLSSAKHEALNDSLEDAPPSLAQSASSNLLYIMSKLSMPGATGEASLDIRNAPGMSSPVEAARQTRQENPPSLSIRHTQSVMSPAEAARQNREEASLDISHSQSMPSPPEAAHQKQQEASPNIRRHTTQSMLGLAEGARQPQEAANFAIRHTQSMLSPTEAARQNRQKDAQSMLSPSEAARQQQQEASPNIRHTQSMLGLAEEARRPHQQAAIFDICHTQTRQNRQKDAQSMLSPSQAAEGARQPHQEAAIFGIRHAQSMLSPTEAARQNRQKDAQSMLSPSEAARQQQQEASPYIRHTQSELGLAEGARRPPQQAAFSDICRTRSMGSPAEAADEHQQEPSLDIRHSQCQGPAEAARQHRQEASLDNRHTQSMASPLEAARRHTQSMASPLEAARQHRQEVCASNKIGGIEFKTIPKTSPKPVVCSNPATTNNTGLASMAFNPVTISRRPPAGANNFIGGADDNIGWDSKYSHDGNKQAAKNNLIFPKGR